MFRAGKKPFPALKGKAGEIKSLIPILVQVSKPYLMDNAFEKLIYKGLLQSFAIDQCLAEAGTSPRSGGAWEQTSSTNITYFGLGTIPSGLATFTC